jgi:succinate dehydrogenase/fumarate reductase flavoprotein subunit
MMFVGATYSGFGFATALASVTGAKAGVAAAEYALQEETLTVDERELARVKQLAHAPLERKGGFSPRWVTQILQNLMLPYFVMYVKHEKRLQSTLTMIEFLRDHLVPQLTAEDPHELRLAQETRNMVLNAEMKLRSSLFRTESRGNHYREDYPQRKDPEWLAWVLLKDENGQMKTSKKPLPKAWWPDLSKPYKKRYAYTFPGE